MLNTVPPKRNFTRLFSALAIAFASFILVILMLANSGDSMFIARVQQGIPYADKIGHFILVGGMAFFANLALKARQFEMFGRNWLLGSAIVLVVFTIEEFMQLGLTFRTFDLGDLFADFVGILVLGKLAQRLHRRLSAETL